MNIHLTKFFEMTALTSLVLLVFFLQFSGGVDNRYSPHNILFILFSLFTSVLVLLRPRKDYIYTLLPIVVLILLSIFFTFFVDSVINFKGVIDVVSIALCLIFPWIISVFLSSHWLRNLAIAYLALFLSVSLVGSVEYFLGFSPIHLNTEFNIPGRVSGGSANGLPLGGYISVISFPFIFYLVRNNLFILILIITCFFNIYISGQRMAFLLMIFNVLIWAYFSFSKKFLISIFIIMLMGFVFISKDLNLGRFDSLLSLEVVEEQKSKRIEGWVYTFESIAERPFLGLGLESIQFYFYKAAAYGEETKDLPHPHSIYLQVLAQFGVVIFLVLFFRWFLVFRSIKKLKNMRHKVFGLLLFNSLLNPLQVSHSMAEVWFVVLFISTSACLIYLSNTDSLSKNFLGFEPTNS